MDELQLIMEEYNRNPIHLEQIPAVHLPRPKRYGSWTVLDATLKTQKGEIKRLCRCDCGTERYVLERALKSGTSQSCGCQRKKNAAQALSYDLTGEVFGELTVLERIDSRKPGGVYWRCSCSCGEQYEVSATLLVTGKRTHCSGQAHEKHYAYADITGKKINSLTALYPLKERGPQGSVIWRCRCDCGNEIDLSYNTLVYTNQKSCGCQKKEHDRKLKTFLTHVAGTSVDMLKSKKVPADNTTGFKGVYWIRGKYVAKIVFQKKQYFLGAYDNIEEAAEARKEAEKVLFDGVAEHYKKWKERADADPKWAQENPVQVIVTQKGDKSLSVMLLPAL